MASTASARSFLRDHAPVQASAAECHCRKIDGAYPYIAEAEISWGGRPVTIAMTHLSWPLLLPGHPALDATAFERRRRNCPTCRAWCNRCRRPISPAM